MPYYYLLTIYTTVLIIINRLIIYLIAINTYFKPILLIYYKVITPIKTLLYSVYKAFKGFFLLTYDI